MKEWYRLSELMWAEWHERPTYDQKIGKESWQKIHFRSPTRLFNIKIPVRKGVSEKPQSLRIICNFSLPNCHITTEKARPYSCRGTAAGRDHACMDAGMNKTRMHGNIFSNVFIDRQSSASKDNYNRGTMQRDVQWKNGRKRIDIFLNGCHHSASPYMTWHDRSSDHPLCPIPHGGCACQAFHSHTGHVQFLQITVADLPPEPKLASHVQPANMLPEMTAVSSRFDLLANQANASSMKCLKRLLVVFPADLF